MEEGTDHRTGVGLEHWGGQFPDTNWSVLLTEVGGSGGRDRFADMCSSYWYPLYAYLRRRGKSSHDAQDLTQGFFAHLLGGDRIGNLDRERGRFRSYLLGAMNHYLNDQRKHEQAQKRGGGAVPISIEEELAEHRFQNEPSDDLSAEKLYDRKWALMVINHTKRRLEREFAEGGKLALFEELGEFLTASPEAGDYREIAHRLGRTEESVRAVVSRMRRRFRELLREQVRVTVSSADEIDTEIRHLLMAFA